jgi:aminopeptidase N
MARLRGQILGDTVSVPKRPVIDTTETDLLALLNTNSYQKGAYVLHMLRSQLGDSAFFRGLREYYAAHKDGNALSDDLRAALEHSSGKDLRAFFDQWLRRPGYPEVEVTAEDDATGMVIVVKQHDRFGLFDFPLPILIRTNDGAQRTVTIPVKAVAVTRMSLGVRRAEVNWVSVDPRFTVLMRSLVTDVGAIPPPRR